MRRSIAALALIRHEGDHGRPLWLAQWNRKWNVYAFIGGHTRPEETFRECVIRETDEELGLRHGTDFEVAEKPAATPPSPSRPRRKPSTRWNCSTSN